MINNTAKEAAHKKIDAVLGPIADKLQAEIAHGALAGYEVDLSYDASNLNEIHAVPHPHHAPHLSGYLNEIQLMCHEPEDSKGAAAFLNTIWALSEEGKMSNGVRLEYRDVAVYVDDTPFEPREDELEDQYVPTVRVVYIMASVPADEE